MNPFFLLLVLSSFFPGLLTCQNVVIIDKSNSYSVDFETESDGWVHARSDYGTGGWNSTEGNFKMTCTSLDENGLGDIIQRPYVYFGEEGNYTMTFRIKTDDPVTDFRVTIGDFKGVHRNFVHEFSLIEAQNQWKEYAITFSTQESGNGYDEGDGSGAPSKGIWVAFRTKQIASYTIDDIQLKRFPLILAQVSLLDANSIILSFNQEVEVPETTQGFICMDGSTNIAITEIKGVEHNPNILILSLEQNLTSDAKLSYSGNTVRSFYDDLLSPFDNWQILENQAKTVFVATDGDDSNPGTITQPFATIQKAASTLAAGDTCYVREGNYHESVVLEGLSGSYGAPIVFKPYQEEKVVFDGTVAINSIQSSPWTLYEGNIYRTILTEDIWQLFADDEMMMAARWPNANIYEENIWQQDAFWGWGSIASEYGKMATRSGDDDRTGITRPNLANENKDFTGAMAILNLRKWETHSRKVNSHTAGSGEFTYDADHPDILADDRLWKDNYWEETQRYYLECHYNLIDAEKEWHYDFNTKELFLWAPGGNIPTNIRGKNQVYAFDISNAEHIIIKGLSFFGTTFSFKNSKNCTVEDCDLEYFDYTKRMLGVEDVGRHNDFTGNTWMHGPKSGSYNTIRNCTFAWCDGSPLTVEGKNDLLENILFHDVDWSAVGYHGLGMQKTTNSVGRRITAYNGGASEFISAGTANIIEYCDLGPNLGALQQDGATIQFRPQNQEGSIIRYNWSHDHEKFGIRTDMNPVETWPDNWGRNTKIHHNVVWGVKIRETKKPAIMVEGDEHHIYHNTSFANETRDICLPTHIGEGPITTESYPNKNSKSRNNLIGIDGIGINRLSQPNGGPGDDPPGIADHNIEVDVKEQVIDFDNRDFRPKEGSILIDAGVLIDGINDNFIGNAPDVGAYETGGEYWVPGFQFKKCSQPSPLDNAENVFTNSALIWLKGYGSTHTNIYIGSDALSVETATTTSPEFMAQLDDILYQPEELKMEVIYFWRADAVSNDTIIKGDIWKFKVSKEKESQKDDDSDGVNNNLDTCPDTPAGAAVDVNGCISLPSNNFTIETIGETCPDKNNGQIHITAQETYNYKATINGVDYDFTTFKTINNLAPGNYEICIEAPEQTSPYCYNLTIEAGTTISGKSSTKKNKTTIEIVEGTAPYNVFLNGNLMFNSLSSMFDVETKNGDLIEVKTAISCEGVFSEKIHFFDAISLFPNPTDGIFELAIPLNLEEVEIELYNNNSQLLSKNNYPVKYGKVLLDLSHKSAGVYLVKVLIKDPVTLKIIKT